MIVNQTREKKFKRLTTEELKGKLTNIKNKPSRNDTVRQSQEILKKDFEFEIDRRAGKYTMEEIVTYEEKVQFEEYNRGKNRMKSDSRQSGARLMYIGFMMLFVAGLMLYISEGRAIMYVMLPIGALLFIGGLLEFFSGVLE